MLIHTHIKRREKVLKKLTVVYIEKDITLRYCKVEFIQPSNWLYSVPNLIVFQHLVTLYLGGLVVRIVSEIE